MSAVLAALVLVGAACSSSGTPAGSATTMSAKAGTPAACHRPRPTSPVQATPVPGVEGDWTVISFDGTKLRVHWYPLATATAASPAPTLLMGPGWGQAGDTAASEASLNASVFAGLTIRSLHQAGYNVLTWDPRGFGASTGTVEIDDSNYEGRDVSQLLDWVAGRPGFNWTAPGDPRVGMVGGSYGGGIQFVTAGLDCRIDAIVPTIAWHSLLSSLDKADTFKSGWAGLLFSVTRGRQVDQHMVDAYASGTTGGTISTADRAWFEERDVGALVSRIRIPTFIVQGTVDTLFTLDEGIANYQLLSANHVPVKMMWFCGGHGICLTDAGAANRVDAATIAWMNRYVKRDASVDTGPNVDIIDQNGTRYTASTFPPSTGPAEVADGAGTLALVAGGGAGPADASKAKGQILALAAAAITPAKATNAVNVAIRSGSQASLVVGAPQLELTYHGTSPAAGLPTRVFAQLVDDSTGLVLGNQITPIDVTLDGTTHSISVPLETIVFASEPGSRLTLQIVATTVAYAKPQLGGTVTFDRIHVSLPTATSFTSASST